MEHKKLQLAFYSYAIHEKYPDMLIKLYFDMLKYAKVNNKIIARNELSILDFEYEKGLVEVTFDEDLINNLKTYVKGTVEGINSINKNNKDEWTIDRKPQTDFFCKNLCSFRSKCLEEVE